MHIFAHKTHTQGDTQLKCSACAAERRRIKMWCWSVLKWYLPLPGKLYKSQHLSVCLSQYHDCVQSEMERSAKLKEERRGEARLSSWNLADCLETVPVGENPVLALHICCMPAIARGLGKSHQLCSLHMCLCGTSACEHNYWDQYQCWCIPHKEPAQLQQMLSELWYVAEICWWKRAAIPLHWLDRCWRGI